MSTVFIPAVLRASVGGVKSLDVDGASIREVVAALVAQYPTLGGVGGLRHRYGRRTVAAGVRLARAA